MIEALSHAVRSPDEAEGRYFGILSGAVTDANDTAGLGRIKARLRGMPDDTETGWCSPAWPGAIEGIPHKSDPVLVFFEDGDTNRPFYLWFPSSKTTNRPNEWMVLGLTFAGMYNDLAAKLNQLIIHFFAHGHAESGATTGAPVMATTGAALSPVTIGQVGKIQKADGSVVAAQATVLTAGSDTKALSGRAKVGI